MPRRNSEPYLLHERRHGYNVLCLEWPRPFFNNCCQPIGGANGYGNKHLFPDSQQHGFGLQLRYGIYDNGNGQCGSGSDTQQQRSCMPRRYSEP